MSKLFTDMSPAEKIEHCKRCIADAYEHLQAEHGPVHLADILDVWDYWTPYLLDRLTALEAVLEAACNLYQYCRETDTAQASFDISACESLSEAIRAADAQYPENNTNGITAADATREGK